MPRPDTTTVETSHGRLAVLDRAGGGLPVVFIHGNSSCKEAFSLQFAAPEFRARRLVALDLPGHGGSEDAADPARTYCLGGYAEAVTEALAALRIAQAVVIGWSLGGHIALETIPRFGGLAGILIVGTPPVRLTGEESGAAFKPSELMDLTFKEAFTDEDAVAYTRPACGPDKPVDPGLLAACKRTDGRARSFLGQSLGEGRALDEVDLVAGMRVPLAVLNGAEDPFVNTDYVDGIAYGTLWGDRPVVLPGVGHGAFREAPDLFDDYATRFVAHCEDIASRREDPATSRL